MLETAKAIDLSHDGLDAERFDNLLASLPAELYPASERWTARFLGQPQDAKAYIVRDGRLVLQESVASCGLYRRGDKIELDEDQGHDLMRQDRPAPTPEAPWRCAPPSILTVQAYEAAVATAAARNFKLADFWAAEDCEADERAKERHIAKYTQEQFDREVEEVRQRTLPAMSTEMAGKVVEYERRHGRYSGTHLARQ